MGDVRCEELRSRSSYPLRASRYSCSRRIDCLINSNSLVKIR